MEISRLNKKIIIFLTIIVSFSLLFLILVAIFLGLNGAPDNEVVIDFIIDPGEAAFSVASRLEKENLIKSNFLFKIIIKLKGGQVQKGIYEIEKGDSSLEIYKKIITGDQKKLIITIPEGLTNRKVGELLQKKGFCSEKEFSDALTVYYELLFLENKISFLAENLEGYLYPDTYTLPGDAKPLYLIDTIYNQFYLVLNSIYKEFNLIPPSIDSIYETVVLASIVEKEYALKEEAPLIASVFQNRINIKMPLQSCATIIYIITEELGRSHPSRLFYKDLELDSPFNTYKKRDLPPAPICSPSKIGLSAVINAPKTDYFYFVVKDLETGEHQFSKDLSSHEKGQERYIKQYFSR